MEFSDLSHRVLGCAIEAHRAPCPGLLESTCGQRPAHELKLQGIAFLIPFPFNIRASAWTVDAGASDALVENPTILLLKSVEQLCGIHDAQLLSCGNL